MNAALLLPLVKQAQAHGKRFLVLPNHFIPVDEALRWKASYEEKLVIACNYLEQYRSDPMQYGVALGLIRIRSIVRSAAHDFCTYLRDLCILTQPADWPPLPKELKAYPEVQEYWSAGFEDTRAQFYSDPD